MSLSSFGSMTGLRYTSRVLDQIWLRTWRPRLDEGRIITQPGGPNGRNRWLCNSRVSTSHYTKNSKCVLRLAESRSILGRRNEGQHRQHHFRVHKVAIELIQLAQPECVSGIIRISLHVAEVFKLYKRT